MNKKMKKEIVNEGVKKFTNVLPQEMLVQVMGKMVYDLFETKRKLSVYKTITWIFGVLLAIDLIAFVLRLI